MISCLSSWKSIKKWIPDTLETTGRFSRRINPHLLQYIRSWQWRSQEKNDCVSHLSKALKAMYARWGKKSYFGDPSWKMHFDNPHEMQVFKALCVEKRATPSRGPSLIYSHYISMKCLHCSWLMKPYSYKPSLVITQFLSKQIYNAIPYYQSQW